MSTIDIVLFIRHGLNDLRRCDAIQFEHLIRTLGFVSDWLLAQVRKLMRTADMPALCLVLEVLDLKEAVGLRCGILKADDHVLVMCPFKHFDANGKPRGLEYPNTRSALLWIVGVVQLPCHHHWLRPRRDRLALG